MNRLNSKAGLRVFLSLFVVYILWAIYSTYQYWHHFAFTTGTVISITLPGFKSSGDYSIVYDYIVDGEHYHGNINLNFCSGQDRTQIKALLLGKRFPVVYGIKSPSGGGLLLSQDYADKFKYTLPDSVKYYDSVLYCK